MLASTAEWQKVATTDAKGVKTRRAKIKGKGQGQRRKERGPPSTASKVILKPGQPPVSEQTTSLKLEDALGNEVKEKLDNWRDGEDGRILINMFVKSIKICNNYSLYMGEGAWKSSVQAISRALSGRC